MFGPGKSDVASLYNVESLDRNLLRRGMRAEWVDSIMLFAQGSEAVSSIPDAYITIYSKAGTV
jgi:hypothetical protein